MNTFTEDTYAGELCYHHIGLGITTVYGQVGVVLSVSADQDTDGFGCIEVNDGEILMVPSEPIKLHYN